MHLNKTITRALQKPFLEHIWEILITGNIFLYSQLPFKTHSSPHEYSHRKRREERINFDFLKNKYLNILKGNPEALL